MDNTGKGFTIRDITQIGLMVALIEVSKFALSGIPNVELTSFWLIMFTLYFGWRIVAVVPVFILIEGAMYGVQLWWIMHLYAWPLHVFGALCAIPYFFIGLTSGGVSSGISTAVTWWTAGIPWDFVHCIGNFIIILVLYNPVSKAMKWVVRNQ